MLLSEALSILKFRLGSRGDTDLDTLIPIEMGMTQFEFEHTGDPPWFLLTEDATTNTVANESRVAVPSNFLIESEDDELWILGTDGQYSQLDKGDLDASRRYWGSTPGTPVGYALSGGYFHLFPTPDAAYTLRMKYFAADVSPVNLAVTETNKWLTSGSDLLLARTGRRLAGYIRDAELANLFATDEKLAIDRIRIENTARAEANRSRSRGD